MSLRPFRAETAAAPVLIAVALSGTVLSYAGILRLALHTGWPIWAAVLLPVAIDGMVVAGILQVLQATAAGTSRKFGWWLTMGGAAVSIAANALTATPTILTSVDQNWLAALTHALPVITVLATLEAWLFLKRGTIHRASQDAATAAREAALAATLDAERAAHSEAFASANQANDQLRKQIEKLEGAAKVAATGTARPATVVKGKPATLTAVPALATTEDREARDARIRELKAQGETNTSIAEAVGVSVSSVKRATATKAA